GKSPLSYFQSLRVERAVHMLRTTDASVDEVAARVGYADATTLRNLLRRRLKLGIKEIRRTAWTAWSTLVDTPPLNEWVDRQEIWGRGPECPLRNAHMSKRAPMCKLWFG